MNKISMMAMVAVNISLLPAYQPAMAVPSNPYISYETGCDIITDDGDEDGDGEDEESFIPSMTNNNGISSEASEPTLDYLYYFVSLKACFDDEVPTDKIV
jgi:hypothetical protein